MLPPPENEPEETFIRADLHEEQDRILIEVEALKVQCSVSLNVEQAEIFLVGLATLVAQLKDRIANDASSS